MLHTVELIYLLSLKGISLRYKRSILGYFWAIANPFAFATVYWVAFKFVMRIDVENYAIFLVTALFPWMWLSQAVTIGAGSFTNNVPLVRRVKLKKFILPLNHVIEEMVHFMFAIPVIFLIIYLTGGGLNPAMQIWEVPLMLLLQILFVFPVTVIGAVLNVYARDIQHLIGIVFSILFFTTPIVYPISMVPDKYQFLFSLNPAYWLIESWRIVFFGKILPATNVIFILSYIVVLNLLAKWMYRHLSPRIAELI